MYCHRHSDLLQLWYFFQIFPGFAFLHGFYVQEKIVLHEHYLEMGK